MKVIAITAHPDDAEVHCAGTLLRCRERGDRVEIFIATNGDKGFSDMEESRRKTIRLQEARAAGEYGGMPVTWMGFSDGEVDTGLLAREKIQDCIRRADPDVILTHAPFDYHPDHVAVSQLVVSACFTATVPLCASKEPAIERIPQIYYIDTYSGIGFIPTVYVDISSVMEKKLGMTRCHKSQIEWLQTHDHLDVLHMMEVIAQYRGYQCGVPYAEGFIQHKAGLYLSAQRLLP